MSCLPHGIFLYQLFMLIIFFIHLVASNNLFVCFFHRLKMFVEGDAAPSEGVYVADNETEVPIFYYFYPISSIIF